MTSIVQWADHIQEQFLTLVDYSSEKEHYFQASDKLLIYKEVHFHKVLVVRYKINLDVGLLPFYINLFFGCKLLFEVC